MKPTAPTPTPPLKGRGLTPSETAQRLDSPPLQGRGKGWGLSAIKLEQLGGYAKEMQRNPTEPEKRLWGILSRSQLGGFKFRRQVVIGTAIADFLCPQKGLIIEVDGDTHFDQAADAKRSAVLDAQGYCVIRVTNADVMRNLDGVGLMLLNRLNALSDRRPPPQPLP